MEASPVVREGVERLLVVMPSWLGDVVMATPTLRALRGLYPKARITALIKDNLRAMLEGCPWVDRMVTVRRPRKGKAALRRRGSIALARRLARGKFDAAILLPNSFRSALIARLARIPQRIGYDRDGRSGLLTDRLLARRRRGGFIPIATRDYYLGIARYLGATDPDPRMELFTRPEDDQRAVELLARIGRQPDQPLVLMAPGANYGSAKMWFPQRYAALADRCAAELGASVAVFGSPQEAQILEKVRQLARRPVADLTGRGADLRILKSVMKQSDLLVTNDTGPRHMAAAFGVPVVTIFGPTDPAWSEIGYELERQVMVKVFCGPCQKKRCPLDHRCMGRIGPEMVFEQAAELLRARTAPL